MAEEKMKGLESENHQLKDQIGKLNERINDLTNE
jgi:hypothetical protein